MDLTHSNCERPLKNPGPSRKRLAAELICLCWFAAAITSTIQTLIWDYEERRLRTLDQYNWSPIDDLSSILLLMPAGFVIYTFVPPGWLFWLGFGSMLWNRSRSFMIVAVPGSIWFGIFWPKHFVAMMGI